MKWIHACYENLISTLQSLTMNKQADAVQIQLSHWLKDNPKFDTVITMATLNEEPTQFKDFLAGFDLWESRIKKAVLQSIDKKDEAEKTT